MRRIMLLSSLLLIAASNCIAFTVGSVAPLQRNIIYAHVPGSICALLCFTVLLIASVGFLCTRHLRWDRLALASAEVGALFATILNVTGSLFSRAEWNIWWTPSPRLVTAAILWFLYVVYLILRVSIGGSRQLRARISAVFGIIAFLDVPMVFISARFLPDIHRPSFSFGSPWQRVAFLSALAGTLLLGAALIWLRTELLEKADKLLERCVK